MRGEPASVRPMQSRAARLGGAGAPVISNMTKPRSQRVTVSEQMASASGSGRGAKAETLSANGAVVGGVASQQASAAAVAAARKRRSSINVYDQPSSLNSRLRQLETDMLRLDEDRTKLFDDTHSALAQYELKLGEIHAILKSRQDNVEKYVEDMRTLLAAKEEFEKQTKLLNEKHDRIHEKFMHRETIISREIKLLKNKFEVLEKNRQFRSMLQKSNLAGSGQADQAAASDDLTSNLDGSADMRNRSDTGTLSGLESMVAGGGRSDSCGLNKLTASGSGAGKKSVRIKLSGLGALGALFEPLFGLGRAKVGRGLRKRRRSNRVASVAGDNGGAMAAAAATNVLIADVAETGPPGALESTGHTDPSPSALLPGHAGSVDDELGKLVASQSEATAGGRLGMQRSFLGRLFKGKSAPQT